MKKIFKILGVCAIIVLILPSNIHLAFFCVVFLLLCALVAALCPKYIKKYIRKYIIIFNRFDTDDFSDIPLSIALCIVLGYIFYYKWINWGVLSIASTHLGLSVDRLLISVIAILCIFAQDAMRTIIVVINGCINSRENRKQNGQIAPEMMFGEKCIVSKKLTCLMLAYLYLPLFLFLTGWVNLLLALVVFSSSLVGLFYVWSNISLGNSCSFIKEKFTILIAFLAILLLFVFLGHGGMMPQDADWNKHHAILYDLMNYRWPVIYDNDVMLTYYIGEYIVPAFLGKLFGKSAIIANISMLLWNSFGLFLVYLFLIEYFKIVDFRKRLALFLLIILWGGAINLGSFFYRMPDNGLSLWSFRDFNSFKWMDNSLVRVHFASNFDALRGAFQHVIPVWISCCLLLADSKNLKNFVAISLPLLFSSTFGFVYFAMLLVIIACWKFLTEKNKINVLQELFAVSNLALLPLTGIIIIYLAGNFFSEKPTEFGFGFLNLFQYGAFYYVFVLAEFLGYAIFIRKSFSKVPLFCFIILELLTVPFVTMGVWNDLCSRGSIPARFILMIMCIDFIFHCRGKTVQKVGVLVLILFSTINIYNQSCFILNEAKEGWEDKSFIQDEYESYNGYAANPDVKVDDAYNYFTLDYSNSLFCKIARKGE